MVIKEKRLNPYIKQTCGREQGSKKNLRDKVPGALPLAWNVLLLDSTYLRLKKSFEIDIKQVSSYNISLKAFKWEVVDRNGKEFQKLLS